MLGLLLLVAGCGRAPDDAAPGLFDVAELALVRLARPGLYEQVAGLRVQLAGRTEDLRASRAGLRDLPDLRRQRAELQRRHDVLAARKANLEKRLGP
ncbi:MAG TPA: hypothetical protein VGO93_22595 [Candidatus Xenobia bacterium]|jgi:hypothetical protein